VMSDGEAVPSPTEVKVDDILASPKVDDSPALIKADDETQALTNDDALTGLPAPNELTRQPTFDALPFSARVNEPFGIPMADPVETTLELKGEVGETTDPQEKRNSIELATQEKRNSLELAQKPKRRSITPSMVTFSEADSKKLYNGPLVMHKWYNPLEQLGPALPRSDDSKDPIKVTLPFGKVCLGLIPNLKQSHSEVAVAPADVPATQTWYIFSTAGEDAAARAKIHACLLRFLLPADLIFVATMYFQTLYSAVEAEPYMGMTDDLAFSATLLGVLLGFLAMWQKDPRLLTIFICVFIVDSLVNLIRLTTIFQFVQFALQLLICYVGGQFQAILGTSWFPSSYTRD